MRLTFWTLSVPIRTLTLPGMPLVYLVMVLQPGFGSPSFATAAPFGRLPQVRAMFGFVFSFVPPQVQAFMKVLGLHGCLDDRQLVRVLHDIGVSLESWGTSHSHCNQRSIVLQPGSNYEKHPWHVDRSFTIATVLRTRSRESYVCMQGL